MSNSASKALLDSLFCSHHLGRGAPCKNVTYIPLRQNGRSLALLLVGCR